MNAVQEDTKLDRAQWRYFCRLEKVLIMPWRRAEALEDLRLTTQALVQANQPDAPTEVVREVAAMSNMHRFFAQQREGADQQTVSYWSEWIHLLNRYMNPASNAQTGALVLQRRFLNLVSFWPEIASRKARPQSCQARWQVAMKRCSRSLSGEPSL